MPSLLLIEAASNDRRTVREVLEAASGILRVDHVTTLKAGLERLAAQPMSAVLLDLTLPEARNLTAVDELRRVAPKVAIMILAPAAGPGAGAPGASTAAPTTPSSPIRSTRAASCS